MKDIFSKHYREPILLGYWKADSFKHCLWSYETLHATEEPCLKSFQHTARAAYQNDVPHFLGHCRHVEGDARNFAFKMKAEDSAKFPADTLSLTHFTPPLPVIPHFSHIPKARIFCLGWENLIIICVRMNTQVSRMILKPAYLTGYDPHKTTHS